MDAGVVRTLQLVMVVMGVAAIDGNQLSWTCEDTTTVHDTGILVQALGEWFLWDVWDLNHRAPYSSVVCVNISVALSDVSSGNYEKSFVNVSYDMDHGRGPKVETRFTGHFVNGKAGELFDTASNVVYRVHSMSSDGHVLVIAACFFGDYQLWMILGDKEDNLPASVTRPTSTMYHRDPAVCVRQTSPLHDDDYYDY